MPSSTSSSEIPLRKIPDSQWSSIMIIALVVFLLSMLGWEIKARAMQHIPGTYSEVNNLEAMWAQERRKLDDPTNQTRLVLLGSSRMLWGADLNIMEQQFGTRPLQLAIAGTGPALMLKGIVDDTDFDGLILIGVTPFLFNRLDEGFLGAGALEWYEGVSPSKRSGFAIEQFLSDYFGFLDEGFKLFQLLDRYNTFTNREGSIPLEENDWKLGNAYADRQTDMWPPVEIVPSFDNTQITNFWMAGLRRPPETPERMAEMVTSSAEYFVPLIEKLRARGGDAVFIRMPDSGKYVEHVTKTNYRELTWQPMSEAFDAPAINCMDFPQLSTDLEIPEWSHLSRKSQDEWSRVIVPFVEKSYADKRGQTIYELMGIPQPQR